nr:unnamed protein product [Callosobruchus chinensis]
MAVVNCRLLARRAGKFDMPLLDPKVAIADALCKASPTEQSGKTFKRKCSANIIICISEHLYMGLAVVTIVVQMLELIAKTREGFTEHLYEEMLEDYFDNFQHYAEL